MYQSDLVGEVGEEQGFLHGGVATADYRDLFAAIEEAVAGGTGRHAKALEGAFAGDAQPVGASAGGDYQRIGGVDVAAVAQQRERPARQVHLGDGVGDEICAKGARLFLHLVHQPGALDGLGEARIILHFGCDGELTARLDAGDQCRLQHGAGRIDGGGAPRRAAAQEDDFGVL